MKILNDKRTAFFFAYLIAIIVFYFSFGGFNVLDPTNVNWLMSARHDWGQHYLGWAFWRDEPWTFPLGAIENYGYPLGTNIGYTDSIPLLALLFKPFSSILPPEFQYLGLWLLFCYLMIAHYTLKILQLYKINLLYALPVIAIVVGNPCLWFRYIHPALCAHGFILAGIYWYLIPSNADNVNKLNRNQVIAALLASLIHPYIWALVVGFNFIIPIKHWIYDKTLTLKKAVIFPSVTFVGTLILWFIVGLIDFKGQSEYAAKLPFETPYNLNSLYNSWGLSSFLPGLSRGSENNYESYMYLGLGMFAILFLAIIVMIINRDIAKKIFSDKSLMPLAVLVLLMSVFSISNKAMIGDTVLFDIPLPKPILFVGKVFRASARFFWVAYYLIMLFFCILFIKNKFARKFTLPVLLIFTLLQVYDLKALYTTRTFTSGTYDTPLDDASWKAITKDYDHIITYMPFVVHNLNFGDWQDLLYLSLQNKKPITAGNTARENTGAVKAYRDSLTNAIENEPLPEEDLYVTTPEFLPVFGTQLYNKHLVAEYLNGFYLLHTPNRKSGIRYNEAEVMKKLDSVRAYYSEKATFAEFKPDYNKKITFNLEAFSRIGGVLRCRGWAFIEETQDNRGDSIFITIKRDNKLYRTPVRLQKRPDLKDAFKRKNLDDSGFIATVYSEFKNTDSIGIAIKTANGKWAYTPTGKTAVNTGYTELKTINFLPKTNPEHIGNVDELVVTTKEVRISGWSIIKTADSDKLIKQVVFKGKNGTYVIDEINNILRPDVTASYKPRNYDNSGFSIAVVKKSLPRGSYKPGIILKEKATGKESLFWFDGKEFEIK